MGMTYCSNVYALLYGFPAVLACLICVKQYQVDTLINNVYCFQLLCGYLTINIKEKNIKTQSFIVVTQPERLQLHHKYNP